MRCRQPWWGGRSPTTWRSCTPPRTACSPSGRICDARCARACVRMCACVRFWVLIHVSWSSSPNMVQELSKLVLCGDLHSSVPLSMCACGCMCLCMCLCLCLAALLLMHIMLQTRSSFSHPRAALHACGVCRAEEEWSGLGETPSFAIHMMTVMHCAGVPGLLLPGGAWRPRPALLDPQLLPD